MIAISGALLTALEAGTASAVKKDGKEAAFAESFQKAANDGGVIGGASAKTQRGGGVGKKGSTTGTVRQRQTLGAARNVASPAVRADAKASADGVLAAVVDCEASTPSGEDGVATKDAVAGDAAQSGRLSDATTTFGPEIDGSVGQVPDETTGSVAGAGTLVAIAPDLSIPRGPRLDTGKIDPEPALAVKLSAGAKVPDASLAAAPSRGEGKTTVASRWSANPRVGVFDGDATSALPQDVSGEAPPFVTVNPAQVSHEDGTPAVSAKMVAADLPAVAADRDVQTVEPAKGFDGSVGVPSGGQKDRIFTAMPTSPVKPGVTAGRFGDRLEARRADDDKAATKAGSNSLSGLAEGSWDAPLDGPAPVEPVFHGLFTTNVVAGLTTDADPVVAAAEGIVTSVVAHIAPALVAAAGDTPGKIPSSISGRSTIAAGGASVAKAGPVQDDVRGGDAAAASRSSTVRDATTPLSVDHVSGSAVPPVADQEDTAGPRLVMRREDPSRIAVSGGEFKRETSAVSRAIVAAQEVEVSPEKRDGLPQEITPIQVGLKDGPATGAEGASKGLIRSGLSEPEGQVAQQGVVERVSSQVQVSASRIDVLSRAAGASGGVGRERVATATVTDSPSLVSTLTKSEVLGAAEPGPTAASTAFTGVFKTSTGSASRPVEAPQKSAVAVSDSAPAAGIVASPGQAAGVQVPQVAPMEAAVTAVSREADREVGEMEPLAAGGMASPRSLRTVPARDRKTTIGPAKADDVAVTTAKVAGSGAVVHGAAMATNAPSHATSAEQGPLEGGAEVAMAGGGTVVAGAADARVATVPHVAVPVDAGSAGRSVIAPMPAGEAGATLVQGASTHGDSLLSPMAHTTIEASATVLEVGVPGGTHGWLKIRAEIGEGGAVQASMSAATHAGQETLRRELPAINAFLESEHVPVSVQVAHAASGAAAGSDTFLSGREASLNLGGGTGQGADQQASRDQTATSIGTGSGDAGAGRRDQETLPTSEAAGRTTRQGRMTEDVEWRPVGSYGEGSVANGGNRLNVMA